VIETVPTNTSTLARLNPKIVVKLILECFEFQAKILTPLVSSEVECPVHCAKDVKINDL
jgi:hypothetical protein